MNDEYERIQKEAREYEDLDNLTKQPGWKILQSHLDRVKAALFSALVVEKDHNKINIIQERYRAFDSLISTVQNAKSIKSKLYSDLESIIEDEKLRKEFDI